MTVSDFALVSIVVIITLHLRMGDLWSFSIKRFLKWFFFLYCPDSKFGLSLSASSPMIPLKGPIYKPKIFIL